MKTPHLWCNIEWEKDLQEMPMERVIYESGERYPFIQRFQKGTCKKCGKIYRRRVDIG